MTVIKIKHVPRCSENGPLRGFLETALFRASAWEKEAAEVATCRKDFGPYLVLSLLAGRLDSRRRFGRGVGERSGGKRRSCSRSNRNAAPLQRFLYRALSFRTRR